MAQLTPDMMEVMIFRLTAMDLVQRAAIALQIAGKPVTRDAIAAIAVAELKPNAKLQFEVDEATNELLSLAELLAADGKH